MTKTTAPPSVLTKKQTKKYGPVEYSENGARYRITATVRYDDECGNGHNSFAITADIDRKGANGHWYEHSGGCCHEEVAKHFPELAPFIKWHLCGSDGPMHYIANTVYHASQRDCWGKLKGEPRTFQTCMKFGDFPILYRKRPAFIQWLKGGKRHLKIVSIDHEQKEMYGTKYTIAGFCTEWYKCPFDSMQEAEEFVGAMQNYTVTFVNIPDSFGVGKVRDLDAARESAIWPDATDAELCADDLPAKLAARLPALLAEFRRDVESLGFVY